MARSERCKGHNASCAGWGSFFLAGCTILATGRPPGLHRTEPMDRSLFRYIWTHSKRDQLIIFAVVLIQLPFYFWSLDLPKRIVNEAIQGHAFEKGQTVAKGLDLSISLPDFLGGAKWQIFEGFDFDRMGLLFALSGLFLFLVLINGAFKYWINVAKGALGERMLRRLRFDLVSLALRFTPETLRQVKPSETATMIKDEVEPIGGFIGDAFVQPLFLGTQALTAMAFILMQSFWLGIIAAAVVAIQIVVIPRMRRVQIELGRQRQLASRQLAGRVGELVEGIEAVHVHGAARYERAEIAQRLHGLFDLRFRIYKWKFMVKFLNNLLAQVTPFLFYAIGGYFALKGELNIGQLVAVISAYKDLPPPLKELIDWDQMRLDVQVKYEQVVQQFSPDSLLPLDFDDVREVDLAGPLLARDLVLLDGHGTPLLEHVSFEAQLPAAIALCGAGAGPSAAAKLIGRRITGAAGVLKIGEQDVQLLPGGTVARRIAYAGSEPILFPGTVRDNLVYGLRRRVPEEGDGSGFAERRRRTEALRTGNPTDDASGDWIDYEAAGVKDAAELDQRLFEVLDEVGMRPDLYRLGLFGRIDPHLHEDDLARFVEARHVLRERLQQGDRLRLVEPFDVAHYSRQSTIAENILFGVPRHGAISAAALAGDERLREALDAEHLTDRLVDLGVLAAREMIEIFVDLPPGHPLFEQFSFIAADELPAFEALLRRVQARGPRSLKAEERTRALSLALGYVEPRHRLGLLDKDLMDRIVKARARYRRIAGNGGDIAFYDPDTISAAAPLKDNLLFGRTAHDVADAERTVIAEITAVINELSLRDAVERVGLDYHVGPAGRNLAPHQRARVNIARCLVRRPDILVLDGATAAIGEPGGQEVVRKMLDGRDGRTLIAVVNDSKLAEMFDETIVIDQPGREDQGQAKADEGGPIDQELGGTGEGAGITGETPQEEGVPAELDREAKVS